MGHEPWHLRKYHASHVDMVTKSYTTIVKSRNDGAGIGKNYMKIKWKNHYTKVHGNYTRINESGTILGFRKITPRGKLLAVEGTPRGG